LKLEYKSKVKKKESDEERKRGRERGTKTSFLFFDGLKFASNLCLSGLLLTFVYSLFQLVGYLPRNKIRERESTHFVFSI